MTENCTFTLIQCCMEKPPQNGTCINPRELMVLIPFSLFFTKYELNSLFRDASQGGLQRVGSDQQVLHAGRDGGRVLLAGGAGASLLQTGQGERTPTTHMRLSRVRFSLFSAVWSEKRIVLSND